MTSQLPRRLVAVSAFCVGLTVGLHAQTVSVSPGGPITETFAFLEHGRNPVPVALVNRIDRTFTRLEAKCEQARDTRPGNVGLADASVKAVQMLREKRVRVGYLEFLEQLDDAVPNESRRMDCIPIASTLALLLERQN